MDWHRPMYCTLKSFGLPAISASAVEKPRQHETTVLGADLIAIVVLGMFGKGVCATRKLSVRCLNYPSGMCISILMVAIMRVHKNSVKERVKGQELSIHETEMDAGMP